MTVTTISLQNKSDYIKKKIKKREKHKPKCFINSANHISVCSSSQLLHKFNTLTDKHLFSDIGTDPAFHTFSL